MTLRSLTLGQPPPKSAGAERRLDWIIEALVKIDRWSNENPSSVAQGFAVANLTESRAFDADTVTVGALADVVGTLLLDTNRAGQKRA